MTGLLIGKECLALIRDGRVVALTVISLVLCIGVLISAVVDAAQRRVQKYELEEITRQQWDQQGEKHPHRGAHFGLYVFAPESLLSAFDPGIQGHLGQAIWLEPHRRNLSRFSSAADDPLRGRVGEFSAASVLIIILPMLIVITVYGAIAGERESGTLRMARAFGSTSDALLWSKVCASVLLITLLVVSIFVVAAVLSGEVVRCAALAVTFAAYALVFVAVGLLVSAFCRTSRQALVVLLGLWLLIVWVIPRVAATMASTEVPLPSEEQFWSGIRHDYEQGLPGDEDLAARSRIFDENLLQQYKVTRLEDVPVGAYAIRRLNRDAYADRVYELHFERLWQRFSQQEAIFQKWSVVSPAIVVRLLSMKFAGTDLHHRKAFEDAAERYRRYFNAYIDEWDAANTQGLRSFDDRYAANALWQSINRFEYRAPLALEVMRSAIPELGILIGWVVASVGTLLLAGRVVRS